MTSNQHNRLVPSMGLLVVAIPVLSFWVGSLVIQDFLRMGRGGAALTEEAVPFHVDGWTGSWEQSPETEIWARLTPLHAEDRRQAFDANQWREHLNLEAGEPFRLRLEASSGVLPDFEWVRIVRSDDRVALRPLTEVLGGEPQPPWALLVAEAEEPGEVSAAVEVFFWGQRPSAGTHLRVLVGSPEFSGSPAIGQSSIALEATAVPMEELPRELAALDRSTESD